MKRTIRIATGEVSLVDEELIYFKLYPNTEISLSLVKEYNSIVGYLCEERPHVTIGDISGLTYLAKEAREWLTQRSNEWGITISMALISNSFSSKLIGNLFLTVSRPKYPIRIFSNYADAEQWSRKNYSTYTASVEQVG